MSEIVANGTAAVRLDGGLALARAHREALGPKQWGMLSFLLSEVAFFGTLITAYVAFVGQDQSGPTPAVLSLPLVIVTTVCLLSSSGTIMIAEKSLGAGSVGRFLFWWAATIALGVIFLAGTAYEWHGLITEQHLTISRNLFGTTYYTLVGFHALHVSVGVLTMLITLALAMRGAVTTTNQTGVELISWYWHFVDGVWLIVFTVVYLLGR